MSGGCKTKIRGGGGGLYSGCGVVMQFGCPKLNMWILPIGHFIGTPQLRRQVSGLPRLCSQSGNGGLQEVSYRGECSD